MSQRYRARTLGKRSLRRAREELRGGDRTSAIGWYLTTSMGSIERAAWRYQSDEGCNARAASRWLDVHDPHCGHRRLSDGSGAAPTQRVDGHCRSAETATLGECAVSKEGLGPGRIANQTRTV